MPIAALPNSIARRLLPILGWLHAYRREWLLPDFLAGLAVWAVMVPEGMAYAGIVGVPPIMASTRSSQHCSLTRCLVRRVSSSWDRTPPPV